VPTLLCLLLNVLPAQPTIEPGPPVLLPWPVLVASEQDFPPLEYTYVEASYVRLDSDSLNDTFDGWDLTGSFELPMNFFLQATVRQQSANADVDMYRIGAGWHFGLIPRLDAYGILSYQSVDVSGSASNFNDDGAAAELGLRFSITRKIELNGRFQWADIQDSDAGGGLGARFYVTERLSVGANYDKFGSDSLATAGLRFEL
jgi:hypothetical protein